MALSIVLAVARQHEVLVSEGGVLVSYFILAIVGSRVTVRANLV